MYYLNLNLNWLEIDYQFCKIGFVKQIMDDL
jgi:hypothetical protein